ncbi:MAG: threonine--tRNA ligase, partial [Candidatus Binataceae bacterium]
MNSAIKVTIGGESRVAERGVAVRDVLDGKGRREFVAARVNGRAVDLSRALEADAEIQPITADSPEGLEIIRHSTAHLMAQAVQSLHPGVQVTIGPVIEDGFFYDFAAAPPLTIQDLPAIEKKMHELARANLAVERLEEPRAEAIRRFREMGENYKVEILEGIADDQVSLYRQDDWIDLCRGP